MTLESLKKTLHSVLTFVFALLIEIGLIVGAIVLAHSWNEAIISLAILALGFGVGSLLGTATSPLDKNESTRFAIYGRAIVVFFSGYAASKLDRLIDTALSSSTLTNPDSLASFRILAFATTVLLVTKVTFACRSYDSLPHPIETRP